MHMSKSQLKTSKEFKGMTKICNKASLRQFSNPFGKQDSIDTEIRQIGPCYIKSSNVS